MEEKIDYILDMSELDISEKELAEIPNQEKMKTLWCIEQDIENKVIKICPRSDDCISLHGAHEARHFIEVLEEVIQETF